MAKQGVVKHYEIQHAVAIHLSTLDGPCTTKQSLTNLVDQIKDLVASTITIDRLKKALKKWVDNGWATICDGILQITRAGRAQVHALAEKATAPT